MRKTIATLALRHTRKIPLLPPVSSTILEYDVSLSQGVPNESLPLGSDLLGFSSLHPLNRHKQHSQMNWRFLDLLQFPDDNNPSQRLDPAG